MLKKKVRKRKPTKRVGERIWVLFPLTALLLFSMVDFFPADHASVQQAAAAGGILPTLIRGSFYALGGLFLLKGFSRNANWLAGRFELMACLAFVLASITWTPYTDRIIINWVHFAGGVVVSYAAALYFSRQHKEHVFRFLGLVFGVAVLCHLFAVIFIPARGMEYFEWEEVYRWRGLTSNANSLGMVSLLTVWANFSAFWFEKSRKWKLLHLVLIAAAAACLWGTESRTSQFMSAVAIIVTVMLSFVMNSSSAGIKRKIVVLGYLTLISVIVVAMVYGDLFQADKMASSIGRDSNLSGRTFIWQDGFRLIQMHPLIGWSFDGHLAAYDMMNQTVGHYHNGYIDITVNGGFIGLTLFLILLFKMIRNVYRLIKVDYQTFVPFAALLAIFLIYNITEVTLGAFGNGFWITMMFMYLFTEKTLSRFRKKRKHRRRIGESPGRQGKLQTQ